MKKVLWSGALALAVAALVALVPAPAQAQEKLEGKAFDSACVKDFYLEGNAIPTQKRNTVILKGTDGKRMVFGLLDTTGYSAEIQQKYAGMMILERKTMVGGAAVGTGAYGFGLQKGTPAEGPGKLMVYDVGGGQGRRGGGAVGHGTRPAGAAPGRRTAGCTSAATGSRSSSVSPPAEGLGREPLRLVDAVVPVGGHVPELVHLPSRPLHPHEVRLRPRPRGRSAPAGRSRSRSPPCASPPTPGRARRRAP